MPAAVPTLAIWALSAVELVRELAVGRREVALGQLDRLLRLRDEVARG